MDIEDSSVPYREFLRSGSYPAITERFVRSGGVLARAAGWAVLVVGAASAGYTTTQRIVTPLAADRGELMRLSAAQPALSAEAPLPRPVQLTEPVHDDVDMNPEAMRASQRSNALAQASTRVAAVPASLGRKRAGAVVPAAPTTEALPSGAEAQLEASRSEATRAEQIAERVRALDSATQAAPKADAPAQTAVSSAVEAVLRDQSEREQPEAPVKPVDPAPARGTDAYSHVAPAASRAQRSSTREPAPSLPLTAAARIDGLFVRGPLSAAHVRRSVERVQPALSECYGAAARQAGHNRFAPVRVQLTIDEAGRVKLTPKVDGAQLPGLGDCMSTALSKLVCQAPDTGTAHASITLGFVPDRR